MRGIIRVGDLTSHGGRVETGWSCPCNSGHANTVRLMTRQHA